MITIYHNPRCSKSRDGVKVLEESGKEFKTVKYLDDNLSFQELTEIIGKIGIQPIDLVRKNEKIWKEVIENRDGVELPYSLGYLFIGTCPAAKSVNTDYALSKKYGKVLQNKNWETDGKIAKIFYTNYTTKYRFRNRELWGFVACRDFKRSVAREYPKNWNKYPVMKNKYRVAFLYKEEQGTENKLDV